MVVLRAFQGEQRARRGMFLLPSMLTVANLFCGYACLVYTLRGEFGTAAPFIGIALVLDSLDGRIARLMNATSAFGVEFDSLADIVSFGVAPAILVCAWGLTPFGQLGWAAGFLYVVAAGTRLARFNIQRGTVDKRYFVGMPSPSAACVLAATVFAFPTPSVSAIEALPIFLRFRSFKEVNLGHRRSYVPLIAIAGVIALINAHPPYVLAGMAYAYLASGPLEALTSRVQWRGKASPDESVDRDRDIASGGTANHTDLN